MTTSTLEFDNAKTLIIPHYFQSQNVKLDVEGKYLVFKTSNVITIPPAEIIQIDVVLDTHIDMIATMTQNDNLSVLVAPDLYQDPTLHVSNMMLYNMETKPTILQPDTLLFSLSFPNISSLLAIPIDREKVVQKARMHKNIINHTFVDLLTRLVSKLGHKNHHAKQLEEYKEFVNPNEPGLPTKKLRMSARLANKKSQAKATPVLLAGAHSSKTEVAQKLKDKKLLTDLTSSETDYVLNSAFLLQSLMKIADIRSMQSHDRNSQDRYNEPRANKIIKVQALQRDPLPLHTQG